MSFPIRLYLTRHGRTHWNALGRFQGLTDIPLDQAGQAQARELAERMRGRVEAVISSDLLRAKESAQIVSEQLAVPLLALDPDLRERGYGIFEGLTRHDCEQRHPELWAMRELDRNWEPPGGEPRERVVERMRRGLERAVETLRGRHQAALIIGHGSSLRMFLEVLTAGPVASLDNATYREVLHDGAGFVHVPEQR
jgi:broad specificity phosphatase PhoE